MRTSLVVLLLPVVLAGCSTVRVRVAPPDRESRTAPARLAGLLEEARSSLPQAAAGNTPAMESYNAAVAGIASVMQAESFAPRTFPSPEGRIRLRVDGAGRYVLDPREATSLVEANRIRIAGLVDRHVQHGLGVPFVFSYKQDSPVLAGQPGIPRTGISRPATAVVEFQGKDAVLRFLDTMERDRIKIGRKSVRLAADFSAPVALVVARSTNRSIDVRSMLFTRSRMEQAGLYQFQPYEPGKIPVVFVHGLLSRPEAWTQALNGLLADPEIRRRYQFWFFLYPTGLPVWQSASLLRNDLDRFERDLSRRDRGGNLRRTILVGHSMGGLISSLIVREGGDHLWSQFFKKRLDDVRLTAESRRLIEEMVYFRARRDVSRVIFIATPHRGSHLAMSPFASFFARLIQLPERLASSARRALLGAMLSEVEDVLSAPANSLRFLQAESPLVTSIQQLPLAADIPYHSIIGDRGRGDTPNSSDGVVPYWSTHLPSAVSEKIVPSGHGAHEHPDGIREIQRILLDALQER